jgi:hypothetical protein
LSQATARVVMVSEWRIAGFSYVFLAMCWSPGYVGAAFYRNSFGLFWKSTQVCKKKRTHSFDN